MLTNLVVILCYVSVAWTVSVILNRADIIDAFWGPGFAVVSLVSWRQASTSEVNLPQLLLMSLVFVWGTRLGIHLLWRWWGEEHEDRRYAAMRQSGSEFWWLRSLFTVFWLQGVILWIVSFPLQMSLTTVGSYNGSIFTFGVILWVIGFVFEAVGDFQLATFRKVRTNEKAVLATGLWRYTRHPNYFGDCVVWWGFFAMAFATGAPSWTAIGPMLMSVLLMKFSGVGLLERDIAVRRPRYDQYVRSTSAFFPWPPKSIEAEVRN